MEQPLYHLKIDYENERAKVYNLQIRAYPQMRLQRQIICNIRYHEYCAGWVQLNKDIYILNDQDMERHRLCRFRPGVDKKLITIADNFTEVSQADGVDPETHDAFWSMQNFNNRAVVICLYNSSSGKDF